MRNLTSRRLDVPSIAFKVGRSEKLRRSPRKLQDNTQRVIKEEKWKNLLSGCKFYLDVAQAKSTEIRHQILSLGGEVEEFLSKDIKIVITSQTTGNIGSPKFVGNTPMSNRPSLMQVISSKRAILQQPSPFSSDSPQLSNDAVKLKNNNISITRGKMALNKVLPTKHNYGSNDIIGKAIQLGVQVISIEDFTQCYLRKSRKEKDCKKSHKMLSSSRFKKGATDMQVTRLKETFFKLEDKSRCFRPLVYQMKQWPKIHYKTCLYQCPFELPNTKQLEVSEKPDPGLLTGELESDIKAVKVHFTEQSKSKESYKYRSKKCGYCDCCNMRYNDLSKHLQGENHRRFVENAVNFTSLDKLIAEGTSFKDFLMHAKKKKRSVLKEKNGSIEEGDLNQKTIVKSICDDSHPKKRLTFDTNNLQLSFSSNGENKEVGEDRQCQHQLNNQCFFCDALKNDEKKCIYPKALNNASGRTCEGFSLLNVGDSFKEVKSIRLKENLSKADEKENFMNLFDSEIGLENQADNINQTSLESLFVSEIKNMNFPKSFQNICNEELYEEPPILSAQQNLNEICDEKVTPSKIFRRTDSCFSELSENAANLANNSIVSSEYEVLSESYFPRRIFAESGKAGHYLNSPESCLKNSQYIQYDKEDQPKMLVKAVKSFAKVILVQDFNEILEEASYSINIEKHTSKPFQKRIASPEDYIRRRKRSRTSNNYD